MTNSNNPIHLINSAQEKKDTYINLEIQHSYHLSLAAQDHCDIYYLLHWDGEFLNSRLESRGAILNRDGITYAINWPSEAKKWEIIAAKRIGMSFRRAFGTKFGIVIPKILYGAATLDWRPYSC